ncbi:G2/mitotic-specific cyclin [Ascosphaera atra]|nr:G2/mitotic-specific cyclin [Ascosphaera atra]
MPPTRSLRSRTISNENDENLANATTRLTRAKASALSQDPTAAGNNLVKKPLQSKKAGANATGATGTTVMTRRRAALGDVSNMTKKQENGAEKEGKKPALVTQTQTQTRTALASKTGVQSGANGAQKLTRGTSTSRNVLGAKDSNKREALEEQPARKGAAASGALAEKKATRSTTIGTRSAKKNAAASHLQDEPPRKKVEVEKLEKAKTVEKPAEEPVIEIQTSDKENQQLRSKVDKIEAKTEVKHDVEEQQGELEEVPIDEVVDLDTEDLMDPLMAAEYVVEIFDYLKELEVQTLPNPRYMEHQEEIDWKMRGILVDWLIEVHARFRLLPETLFLAVNIVDRFLSAEVVALSRLQLVGATAMFIAAKYEEVLAPHVANFSQLADEAFSDKEILDAERHVLATLNYDISYPNPMNFLRRISKADNYDVHTRTIGKYLLEISLVDHRFMVYKQSHVAAAAMFMARLMWSSGPWDATLAHYAGYTKEEIWPVFKLMIDYLRRPPMHEAFFKKYASKKFMKASITVRKWAKVYFPVFMSENGYDAFMAEIPTPPDESVPV